MKSLKIFCFFAISGVVFGQAPAVGTCPMLPADNIWNAPVDTLAVSASSSIWVSTIGGSIGMHADFGSGLWAGGPIGIPFVTVPGTQAKYPATFLYSDESDSGPYGVPLTAPIEGGSASTGDRHAIAVDTGSCILYELYRAFPQTSAWKGDSGSIYNLRSNALRPAGWTSADAAGLPILPGLVRFDEVASGEIRHALRFTVPKTRRAYVWPARHYASSLTDAKYPAMGQRFRLKAGFDISGFPAEVQVILRALKKYGMMIADNGSAWFLSGEPDSRWDNDHLATLRNVPGSAFEAVDVSSLMIDSNSGQVKSSTAVSVNVTPSSASLLTGSVQQFSAAVQNASSQSVTWSVNGILGGTAQLGLIDASGRYIAPPLVPSPATVTIQAATIAPPAASDSAAVTIRNRAPSISSVSPNPMSTGSYALTVNGSGFQSGAVIKLGGGARTTTFVSATQLKSTGSIITKSGSVYMTVTNPDGQVSNTFSIAVGGSTAAAVSISPASKSVRVRGSTQFTPTVTGVTDRRVTWQVNGITGGNSKVGTVSTSGWYAAPSSVPSPATVIVRAVSVADDSKFGSASVTIVQ